METINWIDECSDEVVSLSQERTIFFPMRVYKIYDIYHFLILYCKNEIYDFELVQKYHVNSKGLRSAKKFDISIGYVGGVRAIFEIDAEDLFNCALKLQKHKTKIENDYNVELTTSHLRWLISSGPKGGPRDRAELIATTVIDWIVPKEFEEELRIKIKKWR